VHSPLTIDLRSLWGLDPSISYLNHGSYGACPHAVLAMQASLREEMEREPVDFLTARLPARLDVARRHAQSIGRAESLGGAAGHSRIVRSFLRTASSILRR